MVSNIENNFLFLFLYFQLVLIRYIINAAVVLFALSTSFLCWSLERDTDSQERSRWIYDMQAGFQAGQWVSQKTFQHMAQLLAG